ncbi:stalk domain-containing protein [Paenibacillus sp. 1011MAR3C5]|uniref:stalk domain-containing protein n=1 Tax=Paenibacillus sp. 1011MAR3C5 TaxID=1675787 RepID=UPI001601E746|nr:stalk domain-containing protein [Paenibacillus sp. 1011MAR3C5]
MKQSAVKLLLAASLTFGTTITVLPSEMHAATIADINLNNATDAIERAHSLNLIPKGARATVKQNDDKWYVTFQKDEKDEGGNPFHTGHAVLYAKDGRVAKYAVSLRSSFRGEPGDNPDDESKLNYSINEVNTIAMEFIEQQDWKLEDSWMFNPYPLAENNTKFDSKRFHSVRFDRAHDEIRDAWDGASVTVDRRTGEVNAYYVDWEERTYTPELASEATPISLNEAGTRFYDEIEPFLMWQGIKDPEQPQLVYALNQQYIMAIDGTFPKEYQWENPSFEEKIKPGYSSWTAKKRLLSMYDLNLEYIDGKLAYRLRLKPEITYFMDGWHPTIDAHSGKWLNFLNEPIETTFPPAGDWLIHAAPIDKIGYDAAMVWNNELLRLENEPFIQKSHTLVPFRELLEKLDAKIKWDSEARKVSASKGGTTIVLTVDSETAYMNGKAIKLEEPARLKKGRTYIPARIVLEAFGAKVNWDRDARFILVTTEDSLPQLSPAELKRYRFQAQLNWENKAAQQD